MPILEDSRGPFTLTVDEEIDQLVAHLVAKRTGIIVGKFAYPVRDGYELLTKDGLVFTGVITDELAASIANEVLRIDLAAFVGSTLKANGQADIEIVRETTTKGINAV
jgi:hypothetical protein